MCMPIKVATMFVCNACQFSNSEMQLCLIYKYCNMSFFKWKGNGTKITSFHKNVTNYSKVAKCSFYKCYN